MFYWCSVCLDLLPVLSGTDVKGLDLLVILVDPSNTFLSKSWGLNDLFLEDPTSVL